MTDPSTERERAQRRFNELHGEASAEFRSRPFADRGAVVTNPKSYTPETLEAWYRERGVEVSVVGKFLDGLLTDVIALAPHACQACGHINGKHREGCERQPWATK